MVDDELAALQRQFIDVIYGAAPADALRDQVQARAGLDPDTLLAIYRNSTRGILYQAVELSYPVLRSLVDETQFRRWARAYVASRPSLNGDLDQYGSEFDAFVAHFEPEHPEWSELARLEWLLGRLTQAPAETPLDLLQFSGLTSDQQLHFRLRRASRTGLFESLTPAIALWRHSRHHENAEHDERFNFHQQHHLITYHVGKIGFTPVSPDQYCWLDQFTEPSSLLDATERTLPVFPELNTEAVLNLALKCSALIPAP